MDGGGGFFVIGWMIYRVPSVTRTSELPEMAHQTKWNWDSIAITSKPLHVSMKYTSTHTQTMGSDGCATILLSVYTNNEKKKKKDEYNIITRLVGTWWKLYGSFYVSTREKKKWPRRERPKSDWPGVNVTEYLLSASFYRWKWLAEAHTPYAFSFLSFPGCCCICGCCCCGYFLFYSCFVSTSERFHFPSECEFAPSKCAGTVCYSLFIIPLAVSVRIMVYKWAPTT